MRAFILRACLLSSLLSLCAGRHIGHHAHYHRRAEVASTMADDFDADADGDFCPGPDPSDGPSSSESLAPSAITGSSELWHVSIPSAHSTASVRLPPFRPSESSDAPGPSIASSENSYVSVPSALFTASVGLGPFHPSGVSATHTSSSSSAYPSNNDIIASTRGTLGNDKPTVPGGPGSGTVGLPSLPLLRGVNLGGWLILEPLYTPKLFVNGVVDQWTFDSQNSASAIEEHWDSFCNETMIHTLAKYGINALRIPIGYWAYDNSDTPYHSGADAYLERAIGWAKVYGMKVIIDLHGVPGQQNTAAGCGHVASIQWGSGKANYEKTTAILCEIAKKYGSHEHADTVIAISLVNEPANDSPNTLTATQDWTKTAFAEVRAAAENKHLRIASHDQWVTPKWWIQVNADLNTTAPNGVFLMDIHQYQLFTTSDRVENQDSHVAEVCRWVDEQVVLANVNNMPLYVGEFGGNTLICVNPDGSTFGDPDGEGKACTQEGCQCEADGGLKLEDWNDPIVQQVRRYVEVQMQYFEKYALGWFFWNFRGPGAWGFIGGVEKGFIPQPLDNYSYPHQCSSAGL